MFGGNNPPTGTGSFTSTTKPSGNESKIDIYSTVMRKIVVNVCISFQCNVYYTKNAR
jgi:hypothetical protein